MPLEQGFEIHGRMVARGGMDCNIYRPALAVTNPVTAIAGRPRFVRGARVLASDGHDDDGEASRDHGTHHRPATSRRPETFPGLTIQPPTISRRLLGHADVRTTRVYVRAASKGRGRRQEVERMHL
jgi:hypothetical protein